MRVLGRSAIAVAMLLGVGVVPARGDVVDVLPGGGWMADPRLGTESLIRLVEGPRVPPRGRGSLELGVVALQQQTALLHALGSTLEQPAFHSFAALTGSWTTFVDPGNEHAAPVLKFEAYRNGVVVAGEYTTVNFEPSKNGTVTAGEWQHWDVDGSSTVWQTNPGFGACVQAAPCSLDEFRSLFPNAAFFDVSVAIGSFPVVTGPVHGYVDSVTLAYGDGTLDTDFEIPSSRWSAASIGPRRGDPDSPTVDITLAASPDAARELEFVVSVNGTLTVVSVPAGERRVHTTVLPIGVVTIAVWAVGVQLDEREVTTAPPTALPETYATPAGEPLQVEATAGVLLNDHSPAGHPLDAVLIAGTSDGTLTLGADGSFAYFPAPGFTGVDTFDYVARDRVSLLSSALTTVSITVVAPEPPPIPAGTARFVPIAPRRIVDTRSGLGGFEGRIAAGSTSTFTAIDADTGGRPAASAVLINVTITEAVNPGFLQVFPAGSPVEGSTSNLNIDAAGQDAADLVVSAVDEQGRVSVYSEISGHLLIDLFGYFEPSPATAAGRFVPVGPIRVLDTRAGGAPRVAARSTVAVPLTGLSMPADATAVVMTITATDSAAAGYVQAIPPGADASIGAWSNLNVTGVGRTVANLAVVPLGSGGTVTLYADAPVHLVVDVAGYFTGGTAETATDGLFVPLVPDRLADSRVTGRRIEAHRPVTVPVAGRGAIPPHTPAAILGTITATETAGAGFVQVVPRGGTTPLGATSNLNLVDEGQSIAAAAITSTGDGYVIGYADMATALIFDVSGFFL